MSRHAILLAVDDSPASERVVRYAGELLGRCEAELHVLHVLPPVPPAVLEMRGSTDDAVEEERERDVERACRRWAEERTAEARPALERVRGVLTDAGVAESRLAIDTCAPMPEEALETTLLEHAAQRGCDTVVVGRRALPWYRELFHAHVADRLVRAAEGRTVWVVE
jgi:nucleotide-binding universal stress UspA family protein